MRDMRGMRVVDTLSDMGVGCRCFCGMNGARFGPEVLKSGVFLTLGGLEMLKVEGGDDFFAKKICG